MVLAAGLKPVGEAALIVWRAGLHSCTVRRSSTSQRAANCLQLVLPRKALALALVGVLIIVDLFQVLCQGGEGGFQSLCHQQLMPEATRLSAQASLTTGVKAVNYRQYVAMANDVEQTSKTGS